MQPYRHNEVDDSSVFYVHCHIQIFMSILLISINHLNKILYMPLLKIIFKAMVKNQRQLVDSCE